MQETAPQIVQQAWWLGIRPEGWLTIVAIPLGPMLALWAQRISERRRNLRFRQLAVFKELMATRASSARVSARHVDALNAIEMEFSSGEGTDKKILDAWRLYLDHLNDSSANSEDKDAVARLRIPLIVISLSTPS